MSLADRIARSLFVALAVGLGWVTAGRAEAMVVDGSTVSSLGTTVPGRSTRANAADFDGSVIVGWQDSSTGFRQGAVWSNGMKFSSATILFISVTVKKDRHALHVERH